MVDNALFNVRHTDGSMHPYDELRIVDSIWEAYKSFGNGGQTLTCSLTSLELASLVTSYLKANYLQEDINTGQIRDATEGVLRRVGHPKLADAYIGYMSKRDMLKRAIEGLDGDNLDEEQEDSDKTVENLVF